MAQWRNSLPSPFPPFPTIIQSIFACFPSYGLRGMQHDDLIWQIINNEFCSFKAKLRMEKKAFCRNPYNVTGLCNR